MVAGNRALRGQHAASSADLAGNRSRDDALAAVFCLRGLRDRHLVGCRNGRPEHSPVLWLVLSDSFSGSGHFRRVRPAGHRHRVLAPVPDEDGRPGQSADGFECADAAEGDLHHRFPAGRPSHRAGRRPLVHVESGRLAGFPAVHRDGQARPGHGPRRDLVGAPAA